MWERTACQDQPWIRRARELTSGTSDSTGMGVVLAVGYTGLSLVRVALDWLLFMYWVV